ncbi:MAG: hypothetical protein ACD_68C00008G0001 [uncultured bacterium]|nr:MAG: hypothetical protein ACD_68C00008G0001 [uncultured bacterium]
MQPSSNLFTLQAQDVLVQPPSGGGSRCQTLKTDTGFEQLYLVAEFPKTEQTVSGTIAQNAFKRFEQVFEEKANEKLADRFEQALSAVNKLLASTFEKKSLEPRDLQMAIAAISENEIHFSACGEAKILLVRNAELIDLSKDMREDEPNPTKLFSNIVSGVLASDDVLFLATPSLFNYFSNEKIKKTLKTYSPELAAFNIQEMLESSDNASPIAAFIVHAQRTSSQEAVLIPKEIPSPQNPAAAAPPLSFEPEQPATSEAGEKPDNKNLSETAKKTQKLIKTALFPAATRLGRGIANLSKKGLNAVKNWRSQGRTQRMGKRQYASPPSYQAGRTSGTYGKRPNFLVNFFNRYIVSFRRLPRNSKIFFIASLVIAIIFVISIFALSGREKNNSIAVDTSSIITDAQSKVTDGENALIFEDEERALMLFTEAVGLVDQVLASDDKNSTALDLKQTIAEQMEKLNHLTRIADPILITQNHSNLHLSSLMALDGEIYSFNSQTNAVMQMDRDSGEWLSLASNAEAGSNLKYGKSVDDGTFIFSTSQQDLFSFDPSSKEFTAEDLSFATNNSLIQDLAIFNDRLYILDPQANQIFKYNPASGGFATGAEWKTDDSSLTDSVAFAITGQIYVLKGNGTIDRYLTGAKEDFTLQAITPALTSASKLAITDSNIFVLDPVEKRVVVFDLEGKLVQQFSSDRFGTLQDLSILADEKTLILMDENNSYSIPLADLPVSKTTP